MAGLDGLDELFSKLDGLKERMLEAGAKGMQRGLNMIASDARNNAPWDSTFLKQSIFTDVEVTDDEIVGSVVAGAEYAAYVEMGTGPRGEASHYGVSPEALANTTYRPSGWVYYDDNEGEFVYTEGQPAQPFLYPAYLANREGAKKTIESAVKNAARNPEG